MASPWIAPSAVAAFALPAVAIGRRPAQREDVIIEIARHAAATPLRLNIAQPPSADDTNCENGGNCAGSCEFAVEEAGGGLMRGSTDNALFRLANRELVAKGVLSILMVRRFALRSRPISL